jgi:hypothetical protein
MADVWFPALIKAFAAAKADKMKAREVEFTA